MSPPASDCEVEIGPVKLEPVNHSELIIGPEDRDSSDYEEGGCDEGDKVTSRASFKMEGDADPPLPLRKSTMNPATSRHECNFCPEVFRDHFAVQEHFRKVHEKRKVFECPSCGVQFPSQRDRSRHFKQVHVGSIYCFNCGVTFTTKTELVTHKRNSPPCRNVRAAPPPDLTPKPEVSSPEGDYQDQGGKGNFRCSVCGHRFAKSVKLKRHFKAVHLMVKEHECGLCGKYFGRIEHLQRHQRNVHHVMQS